MSDYEKHTGRIYRIHWEDAYESLEEYCQMLCRFYEWDITTNAIESVEINGYNKYLIFKDYIFEIEDEDISDEDIFIFKDDNYENDKFHYTVSFYNGGTCLSELLEEELRLRYGN